VRARGREDRAAFGAGAAFLASTLAALGLGAVYFAGGQPQLEGALLALSLGGIGVGIIVWAKYLLPSGKAVGDREPLPSTGPEREATDEALQRGEESLGRRPFLLRMLGAAVGALGLAALFPIRSLGPSPGRSLLETAWRPGLRLVTSDGKPIRVGDVELGGVLTVLPDGHLDSLDAQALLIHVEPERLTTRVARTGAPQGLVAYSKICTHAGCPVGLYRTATHELLCPCHQSTFDVLDGARPVFGPAARPLPQLPLDIDGEGYLVAQGDFASPVGPGFWNRS
jgi:quinol---cytochrome c reductase iron-sulfur subunit